MAKVGRPRGFDIEQALDVALELFWKYGYEGTSLSDLTEAMGIQRPALYLAYGSKKDLFLRALDRYLEVDAVHTFLALQEPTALGVTEQYLLRSVEQLTNPDRPMGCFVLQGALVCGPENSDLSDRMKRFCKTAEDDLRERYVQAKADGDLPPGEDPAALARVVLTIRHGLAVMACSGSTRPELEDSVQRALAGILPQEQTAQALAASAS
jgi:AcrR family transcriptional regulator